MASTDSWASSPSRRQIMQSNRRRDTQPEMAVRRIIHAAGLRYRVDLAPVVGLRRRADIVFPRERLAVFIDGCYWHGCPEHGTSIFHTNAAFWSKKIATNVARDQDTTARFNEAGWLVVRIWAHVPPSEAALQIESAVRAIRERQR